VFSPCSYPSQVGSAQKHIDGVNKWFEKSIGFAKANEERKRKEEDKEKAERELVEGAEKQPEVTFLCATVDSSEML
jgi:hypothetical protein